MAWFAVESDALSEEQIVDAIARLIAELQGTHLC